jgi:hypothetical protein
MDLLQDGQIVVEYLSTDDMIADTLTKVLDKKKFLKFRDCIMGVH